jgi:predicted dehydrogenase
MTAGELGIGVIGLGVGEQHARTFAAHPDCRLVALCDMNAAKLDEVSQRLPPAKHYSRAEELIDDPDVQIVSIASNDDDHCDQIVRALRLGKHVFAEKPLCLRHDQLLAIVQAWRGARGARLSTNTLLRRSPRFQWLKRTIDEGKLGTVYCIEGDYVYGRFHKLTSGWRGQIPGYSVMLGGGIHVVDLMLWLSGQRPVEVFAYGSSLGSAGTTFRGTDLVLALLKFDSGLVVKIGANFASRYAHFHRFMVYGTKGTFENLPAEISPSARLWEGRDGGPPPSLVDEPYPAVAKGELIPSFVAAVQGRGEPDVPEHQVFASVATCLAIERSAMEGRPVRIDYEEL